MIPFYGAKIKGQVYNNNIAETILDNMIGSGSQVIKKIEKQHLIPAVTHVDGTGRLQTVSIKTNPRYYQLIETFRKKTNIPILLNTSFNENEPIVNTPEEALECFLRTDMDMLVLENFIIRRQ
jgi:carbamoyltransferase